MAVRLEFNARELDYRFGESLFECAERAGIHVPTSCRKNGKCRECLVEVLSGAEALSDATPEEEHLSDRFRLACRARVAKNGAGVRCQTLRRGELVIESAGRPVKSAESAWELDPAVRRDGRWVTLDGEPLLKTEGPLYGLAIDLGTTTVVVRLVDLEHGKVVATTAFENPQRFGGSDVMARIQYDSDHAGKLLQRTLLGYLGRSIEELPCQSSHVYEVLVAGNSTMRDLFFGLDVHTIGQRPYRSLVEHEFREGRRESTVVATEARRLRLPVYPHARVSSLPLISGHVGADTAAGLLAIGLPREERLVALMDIGTNTEFVVGNRHGIFAASCPAGPAFEGGAVSCGMPALEGAIHRVQCESDGSVSYAVIGQATDGATAGAAAPRPSGMCGSGLIDTLSELRRTGAMNELGRLTDDSERFVLAPAERIALSEADISELAQAKGANVSGLQIVMKHYGCKFADLECLYLAGAFARHLNLGAARRIGFIPDLPEEKLSQVGNAAVEGVTMALCSHGLRSEVEKLTRNCVHVELETDAQFFDHFVEGCQFKRFSTTKVGGT